MEIDRNVCYYCKVKVDNFSRTIDHIRPKKDGGILSNSNKVVCCFDCNQLKGGISIEEFDMVVDRMKHDCTVRHKREISRLKRISMNIKLLINGDKHR